MTPSVGVLELVSMSALQRHEVTLYKTALAKEQGTAFLFDSGLADFRLKRAA